MAFGQSNPAPVNVFTTPTSMAIPSGDVLLLDSDVTDRRASYVRGGCRKVWLGKRQD